MSNTLITRIPHFTSLRRMHLLVAVLVVVAFASMAQSALAGTLTYNSGEYTYDGSTGASVTVTSVSSTVVAISDSVGGVLDYTGGYCTANGSAVNCPINSDGSTLFHWNLSSGYDFMNINSAVIAKDIIDPGLGADIITACGGGKDQIDYSDRTAPIRVTPSDSTANDGELTEFDRIGSSCESSIGGSGPDYLLESNGGAWILDGGDGNDVLIGSPTTPGGVCSAYDHPGVIYGGGGNDMLVSLAGASALIGHTGDDLLIGSNWSNSSTCDVIEGGSGNDVSVGGGGWDVIRDLGGNSTEVNTLILGDGNDEWQGSSGQDTVIARGGGTDTLISGEGCLGGDDVLIRDSADGTNVNCETDILGN